MAIAPREFQAARVPRPMVWPMVYFNSPGQELHVEIGSGSGLFAVKFGLYHPEKTLIAIEHTKTRFQKLAGRLAAHPQVKNVYPLHCNAISFLTHTLPKGTVSGLHIYYPNPYPKRSQRNKRWHAMSMAPLLRDCLRPEGTITLATNLTWYADEAQKMFCDQWGLELMTREILKATSFPRTHFEKKYLERGETCHNLIFEKPALEA